MNRLTISAILTASTLLAATAAPNNPTPTITPPQPPLAGYYYGHDTAPRGHEWQSPDSLAYNKLQPRATYSHFPDAPTATKVLPHTSPYTISLDGQWRFNWAPNPDQRPTNFQSPDYDDSQWDTIPVPSNWNIVGLQPDGTQRYGTPIYVNQPVIFWHQVRPGDWKGGVMRTPPTDWTTYAHRNEVGSYRRTFTIPNNWRNRLIYIQFDGVDSFFYLWINGRYVGFSKNSRNAARFNITPYLNKKGPNTIAVEVYRSSDASFLEAQDMFRLPGIFRSVHLYSTPKVQISDLVATPRLNADLSEGTLSVATTVSNHTNKKTPRDLTLSYTLYPCILYSDTLATNQPIATATTPLPTITPDTAATITLPLTLQRPHLWSAEHPARYVLVAQLLDKKGQPLETVSTYTGFRQIEVRQTKAEDDEFNLAGRYFYINNQPVKLKGVNRHETDPATGHTISHDRMTREIMIMKRANINHVRNSHYPDDPYWYYLTDKYGIYLEDEANLESHEYYYGNASLSHVPEFENAHVARNIEMVRSNVNSPSIVIWSLGNEAGPGKNFVTAYNAIKAFDTTRPVQYERNNDIVDIGSNQYPSIAWVNEAVKGKMKLNYPFHISEYAHSMGNALGNLVDYWNAIESTNFFIGGAIWDWIDQSLYNYDPKTRQRYLAFGGDFGDRPTDGQFVMNGILFGDLTPKPQLAEVKKVYQNIDITPVDIAKGQIEVFNKNYFTPLDDYTTTWTLYEDGQPIQTGNALQGPRIALQPRQRQIYTVPFDTTLIKPCNEYYLNIDYRLASDRPWAKAGYTQMSEQLEINRPERPRCMRGIAGQIGKIDINRKGNTQTITGQGFEARFSLISGTLQSLTYDGRNVIVPGHGPTLDAFRAYLNNDNWAYGQWFANGLYNLKHKVTACETFTDRFGNAVLSFTIESQAPRGGRMTGGNGNASGTYAIDESQSAIFGPDDFRFTTNQIWTVYPDGSVELNAVISSNNPAAVLPRLGYTMEVPDDLPQFTYYGRGPEENYADRKTGQFIGLYSAPVASMFTPYTRPQSCGNREEVRWAALTDSNGSGVMFVAPDKMSATAIPYTEMELLLADHTYKLPSKKNTTLHLDLGVTGLGGNSCGQGGPLENDRVKATEHRFTFIIRPTHPGDTLSQNAKVRGGGLQPIGISRSRSGQLTISSPDPTAKILYTDGTSRRPRLYTAPFPFKQGGTVKAWLKDTPTVYTSMTLPRIETIATQATYASSQEPDYGEATNLTDGDPTTIWHTMYSVTVAPYPHWVDFDAGEPKTIKGINYLPRQDGNSTGTVKDYEIYISTNGSQWGEPVAKGTFDKGASQKTVTFASPVKGRYIRFMALSAQDGRDYASGSEFEVIAE